MKHLGGSGFDWFMLSGYPGSMYMALLVYRTCGWPPRFKEIGQVSRSFASSAATWHYGLCLDLVGCMTLARHDMMM